MKLSHASSERHISLGHHSNLVGRHSPIFTDLFLINHFKSFHGLKMYKIILHSRAGLHHYKIIRRPKHDFLTYSRGFKALQLTLVLRALLSGSHSLIHTVYSDLANKYMN